MPRFRITSKLAKGLRIKLAPLDPEAPADHDWFADLFVLERRKCVIWTHRTTLMAVVVVGVRRPEFDDFGGTFRAAVADTLEAIGMPAGLAQHLGADTPCTFGPTADRPVVGSLVDYRHLFCHGVAHKGGLARVDLADIHRFLKRTLMGAIDMESAGRMLARLGQN